MNPSPALPCIHRIVSGGQTGVDRAALDVAMELGIPHGGWCPRGRLAEDGVIPARYLLQETKSAEYPVRTLRNVLDSDGTLVIYRVPLSGGTLLTVNLAREHRKPCLTVDLSQNADADQFRSWLGEHNIRTLNVAGPRERSLPGVYDDAIGLLRQLFAAR